MTKVENYRTQLKTLKDWDVFLMKESGLPGPRANLELVQAVADVGDEALFARYITIDGETNTPQVFLAVCGVVGLGRLVVQGKRKYMKTLRAFASDSRWRIREAVAIALQRVGDADINALLDEMDKWSEGNLLEERAAIAALCEPRLLSNAKNTKRVLKILDDVTSSIAQEKNRKTEEFQVLRKGLAYCWSVAVVALPNDGKKKLEKWFACDDRDIRWIMRENLKKDRLRRMDATWVEKWQARLV
jgi:hypothetical protein